MNSDYTDPCLIPEKNLFMSFVIIIFRIVRVPGFDTLQTHLLQCHASDLHHLRHYRRHFYCSIRVIQTFVSIDFTTTRAMVDVNTDHHGYIPSLLLMVDVLQLH